MKNFLIVGTQRTGSTALFRALNFHPAIACGNEWTQHVPSWRKFEVTERSLAGDFGVLNERQRTLISVKYGVNTQCLGFKLLFRSSAKWLVQPRYAPALWLDRFSAYLRWLAHRPSIHVIHLRRLDSVEWLKSKYVADTLRSYATREYPQDFKVCIPVAEAVRRLDSKDWIDSQLAGIAKTNPYCAVSHEEFLHSDRDVLLRILTLLDCDPAQLGDFDYRKHTKQSQRAASDYIANYDELIGALRRRTLLAH